MQDVADKVGMSRQLVSIVLRGLEGPSAASKKKILDAARDLGYYVDESASLLRKRNSGQFGVLFTMRQPFEVDLVEALYRQAEKFDYRIVTSTLGPGRPQDDALAELMRQRIEALIILTAEGGAGTITNLPTGIPIVLLGGPTAAGKHDDVRVKNKMGIEQAVNHLVELGHKTISYIGPSTGPNAKERVDGYREAMQKHKLDKHISHLESPFTEEGGHLAAKNLIALKERPTAAVCGNDRCAFGVLETLLREGLKVPKDISIVGFDDSTVSQLPFIELTSVHPDPEKMAELAIRAAVTRIQNPENKVYKHLVPTSLVARSTSGAPRK